MKSVPGIGKVQWNSGQQIIQNGPPKVQGPPLKKGPVSQLFPQQQQQPPSSFQGQQMSAPPVMTVSPSKIMSKVGSSKSEKKRQSVENAGHNFLEPLVELRPLSNPYDQNPLNSTHKQLQEQLAKSHKKSQKLNLIRNVENTSNYFPNFYEPTQAQILEAENRKNEALLQIYTDSGTFSKVVAMTVAASVLDTKLPYPKLSNDVVEPLQDNKKREELNKFCHDISTILGIPDMKSLDGNDYRRLWHLFSIFTNAMDQRICTDPSRLSAPEEASRYNSASLNGFRNNNNQMAPTKRKGVEETTSDGELIETIKTFNPALYHALKNPLERFLIVYSRYVDLGEVHKSANLRHNVLNEHIQRYHERIAFNMPTGASPFKNSNVQNVHPDKSGVKANHDKALAKTNNPQQQKANVSGINRQNASGPGSSEAESFGAIDSSQVNSTDSVEFSDDDVQNDTQINSAQQSTTNTKTKEGAKKKKNLVPTWVQAYHRCKTICLDGCRYDVVRRIALENGFKEVGEHDVWNIIWTDVPISLEKALEMRRFQNAHAIFWGTTPPVQKANHFPGMNEICRKDRLARNLNRMKKSFPEDYNFFPRTWSLPADVADLLMYSRLKKNATYICKPDSGCQGKGIFLARNFKKLNPFAKLICQVYIPKPLLIDGYKFDLRIYILITSCDPLRVFIYNEGIARFATVTYNPPNDSNIDVIYMHLTNYSLNKFSQSYDGDGSKRKMTAVFKSLGEKYDVKKLQEAIDSVVVKTMIAAQPTLRHYYRASFPKHDHGSACFEILGFDILVDRSLKPYLLEVNHSPSFNLDLPVDAQVKEALLKDTFNIIFMGPTPEESKILKKSARGNRTQTGPELSTRLSKALQMQMHHEMTNSGNYRLIYPLENSNEYNSLFDQSNCPTMVDNNLSTKRKFERYSVSKSKNSTHV